MTWVSSGRRTPSEASPRTSSRTAASGSSPRSTSGSRTRPRRPPTSGGRRRRRSCVGSRPTGKRRSWPSSRAPDGSLRTTAGTTVPVPTMRAGTTTRPVSFTVYDLAEAIRQKVSVKSHWDTPPVKEFPASGRTNGSPAGPIRNAGSAKCQPDCMLWEATVASLNVTFFDLTEHLGPANVIDMASKAGVDAMWTTVPGRPDPVRVDLRGRAGTDVMSSFSTEVGIGQYGITVLDHANGMATFAASGKRAEAHFVKSVTKGGEQVYAEKLSQTSVGLDQMGL